MKTTNLAITALLSTSSAIQLNSIPWVTLMQNQPSHWKKIWPQGMVDDGLDDDLVVERDSGIPPTLPPRAEHNWIPYEPHTTSKTNQFTGLYHVTGDIIP